MAEAPSEMGSALTLDPAAPLMRLVEAQYYEAAGRLDSAPAAFRRASELNPAFMQAYLEGGRLASEMGRYDEARELFGRAALLVGDSSGALVKLVDGAEQHAPFITYLGRWVEFRRLDGDPRYRAILKRIGLPPPS